MDDAACLGTPVEVFILAKGHRADRAKAICETCPVQTECLDYANRTGSVGVWGARVLNGRDPN